MLEIGKIQTLRAERKNDFGFLLSDGYTHEKSVLLPNRFVPEELRPGDPIRVFLMLDSEDRPVATTQMPAAQVGEFAMLRVKEVNRIGAFLDWGVDKDLFVPFREQPERMEAGKRYLVRLYLDPVTGRIVASRRVTRFCREDVSKLMIGQSVKLIVWKPVRLGWRVVVDENYLGLLYENELCRKIHPGDRLAGFVHAIRPADNRVDIRLRADGIRGVIDCKPAVLDALADAGGFLPLNAKSDLAAIRDYFSFSKRVFKQVIGMLYKEGAIVIEENGIRLNPDHSGERNQKK